MLGDVGLEATALIAGLEDSILAGGEDLREIALHHG